MSDEYEKKHNVTDILNNLVLNKDARFEWKSLLYDWFSVQRPWKDSVVGSKWKHMIISV